MNGNDTASTAPLAISVYVSGAGTDIFVAPNLTIAVPTPPPALTLNPLKSESFNGGFPLPINSYCGKFEVIKYIPLNFDASFFNIG